jgi:hypothetical protein
VIADCWLLLTIEIVNCWLLIADCWLLVAGCWLLVAGCWLLVAVPLSGFRFQVS